MEPFLLGGGGTNWQTPAQAEPEQYQYQYGTSNHVSDPTTTPTKSNARESGPTVAAVVPAATMENKSNNSYSIAQSDETHDSMVTIPLSGPPSLAIDTNVPVPVGPSWLGRNVETIEHVPDEETSSNVSVVEADEYHDAVTQNDEDALDDTTPKQGDLGRSLEAELQQTEESDGENDVVDRNLNTPTPTTHTREASVNWDELQKTEDEQPKDEQTETVREHLHPYPPHIQSKIPKLGLTTNTSNLVYESITCQAGTGKCKARREPQEQSNRIHQAARPTPTTTDSSLNIPAEAHGQRPYASSSPLLHAPPAPDDRPRVLRGPRKGLSTNGRATAHITNE